MMSFGKTGLRVFMLLSLAGMLAGCFGGGGAPPPPPTPHWQTVGTAGFSDGWVDSVSLAVYNGTPYVAYRDIAHSAKPTVMRYTGTGTTGWELVGTAGFSDNQISQELSLCVYNGTPYVAYWEATSSYPVTVKKFTGTSWEPVGTAGFLNNADLLSLAVSEDGTPFLAYRDKTTNKVAVMKYTGTGWEQVGTEVSDGAAANPSLAIDMSTPYVAYADADYNWSATVKKYTTDSGWVVLKTRGFSNCQITYIRLAIDNHIPYVAYREAATQKVTVQKFDSSQWEWQMIGSPNFSPGSANYISLAVDGGTPYVAYQDGAHENKATLMKYAGSGSTGWEPVGNTGFSAGEATYISLAVYNGMPYVAYRDVANGNKATVMKYAP